MAGRPPKPTKLKLLEGNPGKRPINRREPKPSAKMPDCPKRLEGRAREAWKRLVKELNEAGIATRLDATALELLCDQYALYVESHQKILEEGMVTWIEGKNGATYPMLSPYWVISNRSFKSVMSVLSQFGMTPSARCKVETIGDEEDANSLESFTKGKQA